MRRGEKKVHTTQELMTNNLHQMRALKTLNDHLAALSELSSTLWDSGRVTSIDLLADFHCGQPGIIQALSYIMGFGKEQHFTNN